MSNLIKQTNELYNSHVINIKSIDCKIYKHDKVRIVKCEMSKLIDIQECKYLEEVYIYNNTLKSICLENLPNLKILKFKCNNIEEDLHIVNCPKLKSIDLSCCNNNKLPITTQCIYIHSCDSLKYINICTLTSCLSVFNCKSLRKIRRSSIYDDNNNINMHLISLDNCPKLVHVRCPLRLHSLIVLDCPRIKLSYMKLVEYLYTNLIDFVNIEN